MSAYVSHTEGHVFPVFFIMKLIKGNGIPIPYAFFNAESGQITYRPVF